MREIIVAVAEKQGLSPDNLLLMEVQSDGDKYQLPKKITSSMTSTGVNSRLFICTANDKELLVSFTNHRLHMILNSIFFHRNH